MAKSKALTERKKPAQSYGKFNTSEMLEMRQSEVINEAVDMFSTARREALERSLQHAVERVAGEAFDEGVRWALTAPLSAAERKEFKGE